MNWKNLQLDSRYSSSARDSVPAENYCEKHMSRKRKFVILFLLMVLISTTPIFARVKTIVFSAYGTCRMTAMTTKGYDVWRYERTVPLAFFYSDVIFSDGHNDLTCSAIGIGPFWDTAFLWTTLSACFIEECIEGYYGVSP
jgi:hypothetical protein